jgi:site-specific recombinase XerD
MINAFQRRLTAFLVDYLPRQRGMSANTVTAYRDTFILLLRYMRDEMGIPVENVDFDSLGKETINGFLGWLSASRNSSDRTCNNRLTAIKSFYHYVQSVAPELISQTAGVLSIRDKKVAQVPIPYLTVAAIGYILAAAESAGIRTLAMLSLLYDSGARVQELCDLKVYDLHLERPATVRLTGKGKKTRIVPLTPQVAGILKKYLKDADITEKSAPLLTNNRDETIGRAGVAYILKACVKNAAAVHPGFLPQKVTPHQLRHSKAVHMLENGINLVYIRDFLGHGSVVTTEMYAKASPELKRRALEKAGAEIIKKSRYAPKMKKNLLDWLKENI